MSRVRRQTSLKKLLAKVERNLSSLRDERDVERQRKRSNHLNDYEFNLTIKCARRNFDNQMSFSEDDCDNRDKRNQINEDIRDRERD